jgi:hypothetical protein
MQPFRFRGQLFKKTGLSCLILNTFSVEQEKEISQDVEKEIGPSGFQSCFSITLMI